MTNNPKIKDGPVDLVPGNIEPRDEAIRISIILEGDLLDALKEKAVSLGLPYQTLMKLYLRQALEMIPRNVGGLRQALRPKSAAKAKQGTRRTVRGKSKTKRAAGY